MLETPWVFNEEAPPAVSSRTNEKLHNNIRLRSKVLKALRDKMCEMGFDEIQTPILANSSPEGARDYLVPSRLNPGEFYALPNLPLSTGLNVVMGSRSSGKTHTLNKICAQNDNVKYIKQFALIETDPSKEKRRFSENVACKRSSFADEYLEPFKNAVEMVKDISLENDEREISDYIVSLVKYAKESDRADMFSRCALYNERPFPARKMENIKNLINSVENLLDARELEDIIETYIDRNSLVKLHSALIHKYIKDKEKSLKEKYVNNIVKKIKSALKCRSAATNISDVDFYKCQMNRVKVEKFNKLATLMKKEKIINSYDVGDFSVRIVRKPFESAGALKTFSGRQNVHFREIMPIYKSNSFAYLQRLKEMGNIAASDYYKYTRPFANEMQDKFKTPDRDSFKRMTSGKPGGVAGNGQNQAQKYQKAPALLQPKTDLMETQRILENANR